MAISSIFSAVPSGLVVEERPHSTAADRRANAPSAAYRRRHAAEPLRLRYHPCMNWSDEGIVLSVRAHGETAAVAELMTRSHGRHLGMVHGGRSRRSRPILQTGNHVDAVWKARLPEQLGALTLELRRGFAAEAMGSAAALAALTSIAAFSRLLPERDPHPSLFEVTLFVLGFIDDPAVWPALMVRWELALLDELGFGLDLGTCAATGASDELIYVSPRSGRAVSRTAGEPYKDKLLSLPPFLCGKAAAQTTALDVAAGFALTGHFFLTRVLQPRELAMPEPRRRMLDVLASGRTPP